MAKVKSKSALSTVNKILSVVLVLLVVATILIIALSPAESAAEPASAENTQSSDEPVIDAFKAGTYGGVDFQTIDDVVNYYVEAYNYTKTLTAKYEENGEEKTYYKLLGDENLSVKNILIEGKSNSIIEGIVPTVVKQLFSQNIKPLSPGDNRDPKLDTRNDGQLDLTKCMLKPEDVLEANVKDNGDGTIDITIQPKAAVLSMPGEDSQGRFFNVLGDISSTVESIEQLSFSEGTIEENFVVNYQGGTGTVTINTKTKEITKADYMMKVHIDAKHACIAVLKDKSGSLDVEYTNHFPATDDYLKTTKGVVRK